MLRCYACGNEHRFYVTEVVRQRSLIETDGPYTYTFIQVAEALEVEEWEGVQCSACDESFEEEEGKAAYREVHGLDEMDQPIPYVLVDASVS